MNAPQRGEAILRRSPFGGFDLVEAISERRIAGPVTLSLAVEYANANRVTVMWQQNVDKQGDRIGSPYRIPLAL